MDEIFESVLSPNEDILPYIESNDIITYSSCVDVVLSTACRNQCSYCHFSRRQADLVVPYSTIKTFKAARKAGVREANLMAGERPDRYHDIRAKLDVWGFNSYVEYIYTVAELAFLEGLLVNLNIGYLSLNELKYLQEIVTTVELNLESLRKDFLHEDKVHFLAPSKDPEIRVKFLETTGRLNFPTITGIMVGIGEEPEDRIQALTKIKEIHEEYGHIQCVKITPFISMDSTEELQTMPTFELMLETIRLAQEILPHDVDISAPINLFPDIISLIQHGITDFGQLRYYGKDALFPNYPFQKISKYKALLDQHGYRLFKRLPIKNSFIGAQKYSKKLGQFLDKYKVRLKENGREDKFTLTF